jgi:DNA repair protein RadC
MNVKSDRLTIKEFPANERPRERLAEYGAERLSNAELLAIVLRSGTKGETAIDTANRLLKEYEGQLRYIFLADFKELENIKGVGFTKTVQLKACFELAKRLFESNIERKQVVYPQDVVNIMLPDLKFEKLEKLYVLLLGAKNYLISKKLVAIGGQDYNTFKPKEVLHLAAKENANSIILVHNHPSGDPTPSKQDIEITQKIIDAGKVIGISVHDHILIGDGRYISLKDEGTEVIRWY